MKNLFFAAALFALAFTGCKKDDDDNNVTPTPTPTPSRYNVALTVDGSSLTYTDGKNGFEQAAGSSKETRPLPEFSTAYYYSNIFSDNTVGGVSIYKGEMTFQGAYPDDADFVAYFAPGNYMYSTPTTDGIEILHVDATGQVWSSINGTQSGATFNITSTQQFSIFGDTYVDVKGTFSCKLYNETGTQSKTVTNGSFFLSYGNF